MLAIGIRYLNGFVAATSCDDYERVEWPPHPGRVFMALAAAHFQTGADIQERTVLLWLESIDYAPAIQASQAFQRAVVTQYVPVNDRAGPSKALLQSVPLTRDRQPRSFARAWLERDIAWLIWPDVKPEQTIRAALDALCEKVTRIGHSTSLVQMWVASPEESIVPNWFPDDERAVINLRLAPPGTLEDLERRFNKTAVDTFSLLKVAEADDRDKKAKKMATKRLKEEFQNEPPLRLRPKLSVFHGYSPQRPKEVTVFVPGSAFDPFPLLLRIEMEETPYRNLDLACVLPLTQRWREALVSVANDLSTEARVLLSGHESNGLALERPHLAFLPLGFVGHEHADGHLLGVGLALPRGLSAEVRRDLFLAIGRVKQLKLGRLGIWRVQVLAEDHPPWSLRHETWTAHPVGATHWSTVTPVVFDYHPKQKNEADYRKEVAIMIRQACQRVELPEPKEIIVGPVSAHLGVPPAHSFPRLLRKDGSQRRHVHAILVFEAPVCGPILLGAGRYRGYGFCRPLRESTGRENYREHTR